MIKQLIFFSLLFSILSYNAASQEFNMFDKDGLRHGKWQKFYEGTKQLRYSGQFNHGKEIGTFKFYDRSGGHPIAVKVYTPETALLDVSFYTKSGKLISRGFMKGRGKEGEWIYYHKDGQSIMSKESYIDNLLEGERMVYFENGKLAQRTTYKNGLKNGNDIHYNEKGIITKEYLYQDNKLEGLVKLYDSDGVLIKEGFYKNNKKDGNWNYYKNGELVKTVKFPQNKIGVQN